ncbi:hypothetical protein BKG76_08950 [Mycobacteroides franklinii]|uniref:Uncharacterized protein n=1 Tax=Mycobacteroides franklinii TaxID=948102 RepID=A0A1S1LBF2_9MYCO|nr:hypothetical protein [Mycobacteroides franklinii]OHU22635.1 hypothetical protein BKG76_08950 [Mycobacteroides franklinii]
MLASLGLGKLEAGLMRHTLQPSEVADFLDQASPSDMNRLARDGMPSAIEGLHRRQLQRIEPSLEAVYQATTNSHNQPRINGPSMRPARALGTPSLREEAVPSMRSRHSVVDSLRAGGAAV